MRHISSVDLSGVKRILSIENKANYTWYIANRRGDDELVLYHGGFFSPVKREWFQKIAESGLPWFHWSDIDLGGFLIFGRLKKEICPEAEPFQMDVETLEKYRTRCIRIEEDEYLGKLREFSENPEYSGFGSVIRYMLENRVKLEQEAEIW